MCFNEKKLWFVERGYSDCTWKIPVIEKPLTYQIVDYTAHQTGISKYPFKRLEKKFLKRNSIFSNDSLIDFHLNSDQLINREKL